MARLDPLATDHSNIVPCYSLSSLSSDGVPPDGRPVSTVSTYHIAVVIVFYTIALFGIAFAIVCLAFNIIFRNRK